MSFADGQCPDCERYEWYPGRGCAFCGAQPFPPSWAYQDVVRTATCEQLQCERPHGQNLFKGKRAHFPAVLTCPVCADDVPSLGENPVCACGYIDRDPVQQPAFRSPIEKQFWTACAMLHPFWFRWLIPQYSALQYFLDFALPSHKIGIELDGFATHSSTVAIANDRQRQRALEAAGWRIIRFGGREIYQDAAQCVREADQLIRQYV